MASKQTKPIDVGLEQARRLTIAKQHLSGPLPRRPGQESILDVARDLAYVQWDPVNVVAPAHELTLWSRLGSYRRSDLEDLMWKERRLFQGWGHAASLLLTEDYPIHYSMMRRYPECLSSGWGRWRDWARKWIPTHKKLRRAVLREMSSGPQTTSQFADHAKTFRRAEGWGSGSDVSEMLFHLWMGGDVMIVGHEGRQNLWGLTDSFLPSWAERKLLAPSRVESLCAQRAIRGLGVASRTEVHLSFPNGHYLRLKETLATLEAEGTIHPVRVEGLGRRDVRYIHDDDLELLEALGEEWDPRLSILGPFDNLLTVRGRVGELFGFDFVHENYVPKEKRKFGVYVMPILYGDRFLGRITPRMDREGRRLLIEGVFAEESASGETQLGENIAVAIGELARFLGADGVRYTRRVPSAWRRALS